MNCTFSGKGIVPRLASLVDESYIAPPCARRIAWAKWTPTWESSGDRAKTCVCGMSWLGWEGSAREQTAQEDRRPVPRTSIDRARTMGRGRGEACGSALTPAPTLRAVRPPSTPPGAHRAAGPIGGEAAHQRRQAPTGPKGPILQRLGDPVGDLVFGDCTVAGASPTSRAGSRRRPADCHWTV